MSLGTASIGKQSRADIARLFGRAFELGVNSFDTAESYLAGEAETATGKMIRDLCLKREKFVLATKCFSYSWSDPLAGPNELRTLNRKYIRHAIDRSLRRLGVEYVDIYYCHQFDPTTPIPETVRAMSDLIEGGKALYWGTSNWNADQIAAACTYAERHGFHRPLGEQAEYNILHRNRVEGELQSRLRPLGVGLSAWGPLGGGVLSGKYISTVPPESRAAEEGSVTSGISDLLTAESRNAIVRRLSAIAADIGADLTCLSLAWCLRDAIFATIVTAVSSLPQLEHSIGVIETLAKMTPEVIERIRSAVGDYDQSYVPRHLSDC